MAISAKLPTHTSKRPPKWFIASLLVMLIVMKNVTVSGDDTFCTEYWNGIGFTDYIGMGFRNGQFYTWGNNFYQTLGYANTSTFQSTPGQVGSSSDQWPFVAWGQYVTFGVKVDGSLHAWGWNAKGNLGVPSSSVTFQMTPMPVPGFGAGSVSFIDVMGSTLSTYVVKNDGTMWAFGDNLHAQLGKPAGSPPDSSTPLQIGTDSNWYYMVLSNQDAHICAFKTNGSLYCWGENFNYQVGDGSNLDRATPNLILTASDQWKSVYPVSMATIALHDNGTLFGWGSNQNGILAQSTTFVKLQTPTAIATGHQFSRVAVSFNYILGLKTDGTIWGWGQNGFRQVNSDSSVFQQLSPKQIGSDNTWSRIYVSTAYSSIFPSGGSSFGIKVDGSLWAWGANDFGQLGIGSTVAAIGTPTQVMPGHTFLYVFGSQKTTGAIDGDFQLHTFGSNAFSQMGDGTNLNANVPVSCSDRSKICNMHSCGGACDPSCATCNGVSSQNCTSCSTPNFLAPNHTCGTTCPDGTYPDSAAHACLPCDSSCATCSNGSNTGCVTCPASSFLLPSNHTCHNPCPNGFYGDTTSQTCLPCDSSCATCSNGSSSGCTGCSSGSYLLLSNHSCVNPCPNGFFGDSSTNTCVACDSSCATCSNSTNTGCLSCPPPSSFLLPSNHSCNSPCPNGFYGDTSTQTCLPCDSSCATCSNGSSTGCTGCPAGSYLLVSNNSCVNPCPNGFFGDSSTHTCVACDSSCFTCSGASVNNCTACNGTNFYLASNHSCGSSCPNGMYGDSSTHTCNPCDSSCATCSNGSNTGCLTCTLPKFLYVANHSCMNPCPIGFHGDVSTGTCVADGCHSTCATCSGPAANQCTTCSATNPIKVGSSCYPLCAGEYLHSQWICYSCHASCNGCTLAERNCLQCAATYTRTCSTNCSGIPCLPIRRNLLRI